MKTKILAYRVIEPECYICGSKDIEMLCHHCTRAMCGQHGPNTVPKGNFFRRFIDVEFINLDVENMIGIDQGVHCHSCIHFVDWIHWHVILLISSLFFFIPGILTYSLFVATILFSLGFILLISSIILWRTQSKRLQKHYHKKKPPLPVFGQFFTIKVREGLESQISLDSSGHYTASISSDSPRGKIEISSHLSENDYERLVKYQNKYQVPNNSYVDFHGGFIVLKGGPKFFKNHSYTGIVNPVKVSGRVSRNSFFESQSIEPRSSWFENHQYSFDIQYPQNQLSPIHVIPTLISENKDWAIQFLLQTNPNFSLSGLTYPKILSFKLLVKGNVEGIEHRNPYGKLKQVQLNDGEQNWQIIWENLDLHRESERESFTRYFYLRFKNSRAIKPLMDVMGEVELRFDGTLSGLESVDFFSPLGNKFFSPKNVIFSKKTTIKIYFKIELAGLKLYKISTMTQPIEKNGAIPESEAITRLVKVMSDKGFYVQRVIENLPGANQADARILKRLWVINGHHFKKNLQPINFRIIAKGIEMYDGSDEPYDGKTDYTILVRGVTSNESMVKELEKTQTEIVNVIQREPKLDVEWIDKDFCLERWDTIEFYLRSYGKVPAKKIDISLSGPSVKYDASRDTKYSIPGKGAIMKYSLSVYFKEKGNVPIVLQTVCRDKYGKFAPRRWRKHVHVNP